jgi:hypothetical protein
MGTLTLGAVVVNFRTAARVVGFFHAADGKPCDQTGWPILRQVGANGRLSGGKWVADPAACDIVGEGQQEDFFNSLRFGIR